MVKKYWISSIEREHRTASPIVTHALNRFLYNIGRIKPKGINRMIFPKVYNIQKKGGLYLY